MILPVESIVVDFHRHDTCTIYKVVLLQIILKFSLSFQKLWLVKHKERDPSLLRQIHLIIVRIYLSQRPKFLVPFPCFLGFSSGLQRGYSRIDTDKSTAILGVRILQRLHEVLLRHTIVASRLIDRSQRRVDDVVVLGALRLHLFQDFIGALDGLISSAVIY